MALSALLTRAPRAGVPRRWLVVSAAAAMLGAMVMPSPAHAVMEIIPADNAEHDYCLTTSFSTAPALAHTAMVNALDGPTDMTHLFRNTCAGSRTSSNIDVWFIETDIVTPRTRGQWTCRRQAQVGGTAVCNSADVSIDYPEIADQGGPQPENREKTVVHEVGHSVGLNHHTHTCAMVSGLIESTALAARRYHQNDITLINNHY